MALSAGTKLGPYEILDPLGAGGMGEVYRARDTRLERTVAIKVLNSQLVATPELRGRFEREAKVVSQLQHPHICVLHDIGTEGGTDFLVMEFLQGESLANRLRKGPLPTNELLKIAIEIADALDRAHRAGIVHRDLKPGNVMLTKSGAKLLDFGLAKPASVGAAVSGNGPVSVFSNALTQPSMPSPLSSAGAVIGTVQYMSPEQIQGAEADARSDIFAFGLLLYEMATGKHAFEGKTQASVVGKILAMDPPTLSTLQPNVPKQLEALVQHCLEKDRDERLQNVHDLKLQLQMITAAATTPVASTKARSHFALAAIIGTAAVLLLAAAALYYARMPATPAPVVVSTIMPPTNTSIYTLRGVPALSPDGTKLAFIGLDDKGNSMLYVRPLSSSNAQALSGTQGASTPFWSPDSENLGFFADAKLKRIPATGGTPVALADMLGLARGGTWSPAGVILFSSNLDSVVRQVPASGGVVSAASKLSGPANSKPAEGEHRWPSFLPDGKHFLFWMTPGRTVCVGELGSLEHKVVLASASQATYADGQILFVRDDRLLAQPFSTSKLATTGDPVPVADYVAHNETVEGSYIYSVSAAGILAYVGGDVAAKWPLVWYNRDGKSTGNVGDVSDYARPVISPDGQHVAVFIFAGEQRDIWVFDLARGTETRLTFNGQSMYPTWTPDGKKIIYASRTNSRAHHPILIKPADGSGQPEVLVPDVLPTQVISVSGDGRYLALQVSGEQAGASFDIYGVDLQGDGKPFPVLATSALEALPAISPDGKWLAYISNETGRAEVYITSFPHAGAKWQVSTKGGAWPRWRADGKELFFSSPDDRISAVDVSIGNDSIVLGTPHVLFRAPMQGLPLGQYDVTHDGKKFLVNSLNAEGSNNPLTLVTNWPSELKK